MSIADQIAEMEVRLHSVEIENDSLKRTNSYLQQHNTRMEGDLMVLANERDSAMRKASEVSQLIEALGKMAIEGITKARSHSVTRSVMERHQNTADMLDPPLFLSSTGGQG